MLTERTKEGAAAAEPGLARVLMARAAWLFLLSMVTGAWAGIVLSKGKAIGLDLDFHLKNERLVLAAHLNAALGCFWLLGVAFTLPHLRSGERARRALVTLVSVAAFGNWAVTLLASFLDERGLDFAGNAANNVVAGLLQLVVVFPTLAACVLWVHGLSRRAR